MSSSILSRVAGLGVLTAAGQLLIVGSLPAYSNIFDPARTANTSSSSAVIRF